MSTWKEILKDEIPPEMGKLIDTYEAQMELRKQGKLDEKIFAEAPPAQRRLWAAL